MNLNKTVKSSITINGMSIETSGSGNSIKISHGRIIIDGKDVTPEGKEISIVVHGNVGKLEADSCNSIEVKGDAGSVKTMSGDVSVSGQVEGSVSTMSGDVDCSSISGSVSTMSGDIKHKK